MIKIKGTTKVCGLIGNPVGHSISPLIHNSLAEICNLDLAYVTFQVEQEHLASAVKGAYALEILGMNVTVPHKQQVMDSLVAIDSLAKAIGAVNTLVRSENGYKGYNTDILGLHRELQEVGIQLKDSKVILLGAGGAARAIAFLCVSEGADQVCILNRTIEKAQAIAADVNAHLGTDVAKGMALDAYKTLKGDDYIVIQTSSVGLFPHVNAAVIEDPAFYQKARVGVDIIYNPAETKFMKLMKSCGKPAYNGLKMLLYQGISAFELWNQISVSKEIAAQVYDKMKKELELHG